MRLLKQYYNTMTTEIYANVQIKIKTLKIIFAI